MREIQSEQYTPRNNVSHIILFFVVSFHMLFISLCSIVKFEQGHGGWIGVSIASFEMVDAVCLYV